MSLPSLAACALVGHVLGMASAKHTRVDVRLEASPGAAATASDAAQRIEAGAGFLGVQGPAREVAELNRETQAPMVWLNLHKSTSGAAGAGFVSLSEPTFDDVASVFEHAPVEAFEARKDVASTSALVKELAAQPAPASPIASQVLDPVRHHAVAACDRDFAQQCPVEFEPVGMSHCAPAATYVGPCGGSHDFAGLSVAAKARWSDMCLAWWPCVSCERDFAGLCPMAWALDAGTVCKPGPDYAGPCGTPVDFAGYTRSMLAQWSATCDAHWPCATSAASFLGSLGGEVVELEVPAGRPVDVSTASAALRHSDSRRAGVGAAPPAAASWAVKLVPPAEDAADSMAHLDDLMAAERAKQAAANAAFVTEQQRILDAGRSTLLSAMRKSRR